MEQENIAKALVCQFLSENDKKLGEKASTKLCPVIIIIFILVIFNANLILQCVSLQIIWNRPT